MSMQNIDLTEKGHFKNVHYQMHQKKNQEGEAQRVSPLLRPGVIPSRSRFNYIDNLWSDTWITIDNGTMTTTMHSSRHTPVSENDIFDSTESTFYIRTGSPNIVNSWVVYSNDFSNITTSNRSNSYRINYDGSITSINYSSGIKDNSAIGYLRRKSDEYEHIPKVPYNFKNGDVNEIIIGMDDSSKAIEKIRRAYEYDLDEDEDERIPEELLRYSRVNDMNDTDNIFINGYRFSMQKRENQSTKDRLLQRAPWIKNVFVTNGGRSFDEKQLNFEMELAKERFEEALKHI